MAECDPIGKFRMTLMFPESRFPRLNAELRYIRAKEREDEIEEFEALCDAIRERTDA